jgi:5-methylcytosine-specific restriction endonuclease McrA
MSKTHPWYDKQQWRGPNGLRLMILRRDPICVLCNRAYSVVADHIRPFRSGGNEQECWDLFTTASNLRGVCSPCHNAEGDKTVVTGDGQRSARVQTKPAGIEIEAAFGVKYVTSSLGKEVLDKALATAWEDAK